MWKILAFSTFDKAWVPEFEGTREECLRYLDMVTENSCRLWNFQLVNPESGFTALSTSTAA